MVVKRNVDGGVNAHDIDAQTIRLGPANAGAPIPAAYSLHPIPFDILETNGDFWFILSTEVSN
jgi:hypothetical protein